MGLSILGIGKVQKNLYMENVHAEKAYAGLPKSNVLRPQIKVDIDLAYWYYCENVDNRVLSPPIEFNWINNWLIQLIIELINSRKNNKNVFRNNGFGRQLLQGP